MRFDMSHTDLHRLIYVSAARESLDPAEIDGLLAISRRNNDRDAITGLLIYHDMTFIQLLEGPPEAIARCFGRITGDPRHGEVSRLIDGPTETRSFPEWQMGFATPGDLPEPARDKVISIAELRAHGTASASNDPGLALLVKSMLGTMRA